MSELSWKKEFVSKMSGHRTTDLVALKQALKKYRGLAPRNLARHKVTYEAMFDTYCTSTGCSLCARYCRNEGFYCQNTNDNTLFYRCPLMVDFGRDTFMGCSSADHPWTIAEYDDNPAPMIVLLRRCIAKARKAKK